VIFPAYKYNYTAYFYLYWFSNAIGVLLGFKVIHEIFLDVFRPFHTLRDLGTVLFKWAGLVMLLVAGVVSVSGIQRDGAVDAGHRYDPALCTDNAGRHGHVSAVFFPTISESAAGNTALGSPWALGPLPSSS